MSKLELPPIVNAVHSTSTVEPAHAYAASTYAVSSPLIVATDVALAWPRSADTANQASVAPSNLQNSVLTRLASDVPLHVSKLLR
jgi:hypothetical protein